MSALACSCLTPHPGAVGFARMSDVTRLLDRVQAGDPEVAEPLLPLVSGELLAVHDALEKLAQRDPISARTTMRTKSRSSITIECHWKGD